MKTSNRAELTLHMEGLPSNEGDMLAGVYAKKIEEFRAVFDEAQSVVGVSEKDDLLISNLTHNSPSAATFCATGLNGGLAFNSIRNMLTGINTKTYKLTNTQIDYFMKLRDFCKTNFNKIETLWFSSVGADNVYVTPETIEQIDTLLLPDSISYGSVKGVIRKYSGDTVEKYVYLYPVVGGRVRCVFDDDKKEQISHAVEQNVVIHGKLKYHSGEFSPYEIDVYRLEELKHDDDLAKLSEITIHIDSSDYIRIIKDIRNEW